MAYKMDLDDVLFMLNKNGRSDIVEIILEKIPEAR
tara:strand:+ start:475 stop:579 length:105 start_codon:yes stop_codon:yes gene_type:complete